MRFEQKDWVEFTHKIWEQAQKNYPSIQTGDFDIFKKGISAFHVTLPTSVYKKAETIIQKIDAFAQSEEQLLHLREFYKNTPLILKYLNNKYPTSSVLMAYDFHWSNNELKLIEVNTNASGFLYSILLSEGWGLKIDKMNDALIQSFQEESGQLSHFKLAITDKNITTQKMYLEFLLYKDLFEQKNIPTELCETKDLHHSSFDFVYNRSTDFYFEEPENLWLQNQYLNHKIKISPHPKTYLLYADKERLLDFTKAELGPELLKTYSVTKENLEECWDQSKKLFFKPKQSYGGRGVYRGANITRTTINKIVDQNYIAQEYAAPGLLNNWKYDLRFYVYKNNIQHVAARVYQGQVTGFQVDGSGYAAVSFEEDQN